MSHNSHNAENRFAAGYQQYLTRGWSPIRVGEKAQYAKTPAPKNHTGYNGVARAKDETMRFWAQDPGHWNIALRLSDGIIGIDVDNYDGKQGYEVIKDWESQFGPLPPTWVSTARDLSEGGIHYFRAPTNATFITKDDRGVEIIQRCHRYAVAAPSVNPRTGTEYRWYTPDGQLSDTPPYMNTLPHLPPEWASGLYRAPSGLTPSTVAISREWADANLADPYGEPCNYMRAALDNQLEELADSMSRHDTMTVSTMSLISAGMLRGHRGLATALAEYDEAFTATVTDRDTEGELQRAVRGAVEKLDGEPFDADDMCRCRRALDTFLPAAMPLDVDAAEEPTRQEAPEPEAAATEAPAADVAAAIDWYAADVEAWREERGFYEPTQQGMVHRFQEAYGHWLAYVPGDGWRAYREGYWQTKSEASVRRLADSLTSAVRRELDAIKGLHRDNEKKLEAARGPLSPEEMEKASKNDPACRTSFAALLAWQNLLASIQGTDFRNAVVKHARDYMTRDLREFDAHPELLTIESGTLNLARMEEGVRRHSPDDLLARKAPVTYDPEAEPEGSFWQEVLDRVQPEPDIQRFLRMMAGLTLLGDNRKEAFVVCHGDPGTGKSTIVEAITATLGDELAAEVDSATLRPSKKSGSDASPDKARLLGRRMIYVGELEGTVDVNLVKGWTGGERITARALYQEPIEFLPQFLPWATSNTMPEFKGDDAIWRRVYVVEFGEVIPFEERADKTTMRRNLESQRSVILNWMLDGLADYERHGLVVPDSVRSATTEAQEAEAWEPDFIARFLEKTDHAGDKVLLSAVLEKYEQHGRPSGKLSPRALNRRLSPYLGKSEKSDRGQAFHGWTFRGAPRGGGVIDPFST